ncbi:MAG: hypothetical protein IJF88_06905 [Oscillospiraceae bacterium]|nr:hypothetical protein [Oscillospiraceae bacterium]
MNHIMLDSIVNCARCAGQMLAFSSDTIVLQKGENDFVTSCDTSVQDYLIKSLGEKFNNFFFVAEEKENIVIPDTEGFIIDPIDGTLNYINGIPYSAICIAYINKKTVQCAVVYNPFLDETFTAVKGEGAYLNGNRIHCKTDNLKRSVLLIDDFWRGDTRVISDFVAGYRCIGSAEIAICYVACGRAAGYISQNIHIWDFAAGKLILEEAGACLLDRSNRMVDILLKTNRVLACPPLFRDTLFELCKKAES